MVKRRPRHWMPPFHRHQHTNFSLGERSLRSIFAQCFLLPHVFEQVLAHVRDRKADHAV